MSKKVLVSLISAAVVMVAMIVCMATGAVPAEVATPILVAAAAILVPSPLITKG